MELAQKQEIKRLLELFVTGFPSQKQAAAQIKDASEATIINILKGSFEGIADKMWRNIGKQVGWTNTGSWQMVETRNLKIMTTFFDDAKELSNVFAIIGPAGSSKSFTADYYAKHHHHVYHIECDDYYNRKMFLAKILEKLGKENTGFNIHEMMDYIVQILIKQDSPLLIIDEADKLNDQVLYFFITLYNRLRGKCGIVLLATDYFEKRIRRGLRLRKKGFAEIFSRIGRSFIELAAVSEKETEQICTANGVKDPETIQIIKNTMEGDLRCIERQIHKYKRLEERKRA